MALLQKVNNWTSHPLALLVCPVVCSGGCSGSQRATTVPSHLCQAREAMVTVFVKSRVRGLGKGGEGHEGQQFLWKP